MPREARQRRRRRFPRWWSRSRAVRAGFELPAARSGDGARNLGSVAVGKAIRQTRQDLSREAERERKCPVACLGRREMPRADLVDDAAFRLRSACARPRTVCDVRSGYRAGGCERYRRRNGARQRWILLQPKLVVAEPQLRLVAPHECTELAHVALR